jgi:hypothetical protein
MRRTRLEPARDLHRTGGLGQPLTKGVIHAIQHQDAVGTDTNLPGIAVFRDDRTLAQPDTALRPFGGADRNC